MYPINSATEALFAQGSKQYINIAFDGTESAMTITQANVLENGLSINRFSASSNKIELGSVSASELTLKLDNRNGIYNDTTFEGAELFVRVGVKNDADVMTYVPLGYFTVDEAPRKLSQITLTALDRMVMFDKPASASDITFPISVQNFVNRICTLCGVSLATTDFSGFANANYVINEFPTGNNITYRQILSWLAEILGVCAFIDWDGKLALKWYSDTSISFDTHNRYISDLQENAIKITGIQVVQDGQTYSAGTEGYVISIEGNPLIQHDYQSIATALNTKLNGFSYTPFTATVLPMPYIYPLDKATYIDKNGVSHAVIITDVTFTTGKSTEIQGKGESTTKSNYASIDPLTKGERIIISELKKEMDNKITAKEQALIELNKIIGNALGLYTTAVKDETGATTYYFHNGDTLANSNIIYTFGSGGFAWTNSWNGGSPVWNYGITKDGNAILNVLSTYKIISDYIEAGAVTAEKIDVEDLFAKNLTMKGTFTAKGSAYINPGKEELDYIKQILFGVITPTAEEIALYDFSGDGKITITDFTQCQSMVAGMMNMADITTGFAKKLSPVTVTITPSDVYKTIRIQATNMWGRTIDKYIGVNSPFLGDDNQGVFEVFVNGSETIADILSRVKSLEEYTGGQVANSVANALTVKANDTTLYTFNGSEAKTINIKAGANVTLSTDSAGNITIAAVSPTADAGEVVYEATSGGLYCDGKTANNSNNSVAIEDSSYKYKRLRFYCKGYYGLVCTDMPLDRECDAYATGNDRGKRYGGVIFPTAENGNINSTGIGPSNHMYYELKWRVEKEAAGWRVRVVDSGWLGFNAGITSNDDYTNNSGNAVAGTNYISWNQRHNNQYCIYKIVGYKI